MIIWIIVIFFAFVFALTLARAIRRHLVSRRRRNPERRCVCGYIVEKLGSPRCPECGRAIGFDATFEEMGVSKEELEEAARRKALRGGRKS